MQTGSILDKGRDVSEPEDEIKDGTNPHGEYEDDKEGLPAYIGTKYGFAHDPTKGRKLRIASGSGTNRNGRETPCLQTLAR